jgi:hypothetical protein
MAGIGKDYIWLSIDFWIEHWLDVHSCTMKTIGCWDNIKFNLVCEKSMIWFIMIPRAKLQQPIPSIKATNCIPRFSCFRDFVWKSKSCLTFLFSINNSVRFLSFSWIIRTSHFSLWFYLIFFRCSLES